VDPAAEAMILNADDRPYRESAAAASNQDGRGVDHGRGYKAALAFRQEKPPSFRGVAAATNPESRDFRVRLAPRNNDERQIDGFHGAGTTR
jgi:hypothetical protein